MKKPDGLIRVTLAAGVGAGVCLLLREPFVRLPMDGSMTFMESSPTQAWLAMASLAGGLTAAVFHWRQLAGFFNGSAFAAILLRYIELWRQLTDARARLERGNYSEDIRAMLEEGIAQTGPLWAAWALLPALCLFFILLATLPRRGGKDQGSV